eukprot:2456950-Pleurochrysis_carterae.AAC.4
MKGDQQQGLSQCHLSAPASNEPCALSLLGAFAFGEELHVLVALDGFSGLAAPRTRACEQLELPREPWLWSEVGAAGGVERRERGEELELGGVAARQTHRLALNLVGHERVLARVKRRAVPAERTHTRTQGVEAR